MDIVGIIPAAGTATRLSPLPCSKEILPVGMEQWGDKPYKRPKVAIQYLLDAMREADIQKTYVIIRKNKWDIPAFLGDGNIFGINIAYLMMGLPYGTPFSINQAYPFINSNLVALGFPDILIRPQNVYRTLISKLKKDQADVVLGLFRATNPQKMDMIEFDKSSKISRIVIKPKKTVLQYTYINAVWTPVFSKYMNEYLIKKCGEIEKTAGKELYVGHVLQAFMNDGNAVTYSIIENGSYTDIGTLDDYSDAVSEYWPD